MPQKMHSKPCQELQSWVALKKHTELFRFSTIKELSKSEVRTGLLQIATQNICIDFSRQRINEHTIDLLISLAKERNLQEKIDTLMNGHSVNFSEARPALHTALRQIDGLPLIVDGKNVIEDICAAREQMRVVAEQIRTGLWLGFSGKPIKDIVNIGIGGSDLGPRFCIKALSAFTEPNLGYHFVSDGDPNAFKNTVVGLNPETTLFIVSSKSFTTQETLYNAKAALIWLDQPLHTDKHFIAVTANEQGAKDLGFNQVVPIWSWVGGRYSLCSAINLITVIALGYEQFLQLLAGANSMDRHFQNSPFEKNLPVLLGLVGIWNNNFLNIHNLLMWTYAQQLEYFVPYVQQLDMESNGKSIDNQGRFVNYATGPVVWGGPGNQAQHSYYQLLCQGTHRLTVDFITLAEFDGQTTNEVCYRQQTILAEGITDPSDNNKYILGNTPLNSIKLNSCTPFVIGELIALYEHKIYMQSVIWDINAFDQPGVESAKIKPVISYSEEFKALHSSLLDV